MSVHLFARKCKSYDKSSVGRVTKAGPAGAVPQGLVNRPRLTLYMSSYLVSENAEFYFSSTNTLNDSGLMWPFTAPSASFVRLLTAGVKMASLPYSL